MPGVRFGVDESSMGLAGSGLLGVTGLAWLERGCRSG